MAINWLGNRYGETYEYVKVSWDNWNEFDTYDYITSGSLELATTSDLKVTGTFQFQGMETPDVNNLLRVYYSFYDDKDVYTRQPLGTFFTTFGSQTLTAMNNGLVSSGSLTASSLLIILQRQLTGVPYTVKKNTNAIYEAQQIVRNCGLNVDYLPDSTILTADHTFSAGTTYLEIVNWLCDLAKYRNVYTDEYGTVVFRPKVEISQNDSVWTFENDDQSIMYPELSQENNWYEVPNVIRLLFNTDAACAVAEAKNVRGARTSLEANGNREITKFEEVSELGKGKVLTNLVNLAEDKLLEESCDTEYVTFSHAWVPIYIYDVVTVNYSTKSWTGFVDNMSITLSPSTKTQTKIRRDLYDDIIVEKSGEVIRNRNVNS